MPTVAMGARTSQPRGSAIAKVDDHHVGRFTAMGGPCEVLVETDDPSEAATLTAIAEAEARRIETKFSRYRTGNVVHAINHAGGRPVRVDGETTLLLDYAATCHQISNGKFDITSGALRRAWTFDGGSQVPEPEAIRAALEHVGWHRVTWHDGTLTLPPGMEIDLGGIGKEYAVDRAAALLTGRTQKALLVNFGGDLFATRPRSGDRPWAVGVEDPSRAGTSEAAVYRIDLSVGGLATSGDARRFVTWRGRRLGHILDPRTGWPIEDAPRSVTVLGRNCLEAGTLSTLAYLQGPRAAAFLDEEGARYWIL